MVVAVIGDDDDDVAGNMKQPTLSENSNLFRFLDKMELFHIRNWIILFRESAPEK